MAPAAETRAPAHTDGQVGDIAGSGGRAHLSFHNYGIAADLAFYNDAGQITWPEQGDYAKLWTRYGELAKQQGLTWGGDWKRGTDRPHIEYHPGLNSSQAANLKATYAKGGLEAAWDQMGIGEQPDQKQQQH